MEGKVIAVKMNVLMIVSWYPSLDDRESKIGIFHREMADDLKRLCDVAIYYPFDKKMRKPFSSENDNGIMTFRTRCKDGLVGKLINRFMVLWSFLKIRKVFNPDIIHAHVALGAGRYSAALGKIFGIPMLVTEHLPLELSGYNKKKNREIASSIYQNSKYNACVSPDQMKKLASLFPEAKFDVIYNGVIMPETDHQNHYRILNCVNMLIVASMYDLEIKGYQYLLPAIRELKLQNKRIMLHLVGGGEYLAHYQDLAKTLEIEDACIFYGACEKRKVYEIMSEMDFCISASLFEASGVYVQEAMMIGKPLIVTRSGGANSLVTDKTAIIVDKGSTAALVQGISTMIDSYSQFDPDEIRDYAFSNFEISRISEQYKQVYDLSLIHI